MQPKFRVAKYRGGYAVVWYDEEGKRHRRALGEDKWKAHAVAGEVVRAVTAPAGPLTVGQIVERYLEQSDAIGKDTMRAHWRAAAHAFAALSPGQVAEDTCRAYGSERGRSVKLGTIRKELGVVRAALGWARAKRLVEHLPDMWLPAAPPPRDRRLTRDELTALQNACAQPHLLLFVLVARYTAARAGAILGLRWAQIDHTTRRIDLGGSGRQKRRAVVPMHPNLAWALAIAQKGAMSPFVIEYAGRKVGSVKRGFRAACARAKLKGVSPHVLRHTAASWMAEDGVSMAEIAQFLGHTSPAVTFRTYARYSPDYLQKAIKALG